MARSGRPSAGVRELGAGGNDAAFGAGQRSGCQFQSEEAAAFDGAGIRRPVVRSAVKPKRA